MDAVSSIEADKVVLREGDQPPVQQMQVKIPPKGEVSLQEGGGRPYLELVGVHRQLGAAPVPVTFRFPTAGTVTINAPVLPE